MLLANFGSIIDIRHSHFINAYSDKYHLYIKERLRYLERKKMNYEKIVSSFYAYFFLCLYIFTRDYPNI
jgi:hypothetical protein